MLTISTRIEIVEAHILLVNVRGIIEDLHLIKYKHDNSVTAVSILKTGILISRSEQCSNNLVMSTKILLKTFIAVLFSADNIMMTLANVIPPSTSLQEM